MQALEGRRGHVPGKRKRWRFEFTSGNYQVDARVLPEDKRNVDGVGDDGQLMEMKELSGQLRGRGSGIQDDAVAFPDQREGLAGNLLLLFLVRLVEQRAGFGKRADILEECTAVLPLDIPHFLKGLKVLADGDLGDLEDAGEVLDLGVSVLADQSENVLSSFVQCHG